MSRNICPLLLYESRLLGMVLFAWWRWLWALAVYLIPFVSTLCIRFSTEIHTFIRCITDSIFVHIASWSRKYFGEYLKRIVSYIPVVILILVMPYKSGATHPVQTTPHLGICCPRISPAEQDIIPCPKPSVVLSGTLLGLLASYN